MGYKYKKYIEESEEIRCGFKVSSNRKKVWNIQLGLIEEVKKICKKHNIKYYAEGGTLLGAIRHKGFIPWDDDIDIMMFRKDFETFQKIAQKELPSYMKLWECVGGFFRLTNMDTTVLGSDDDWKDKDFIGGICIDIFPIDYASKFTIINRIKSVILLFLGAILFSQKAYQSVNKMKKWKQIFIYICKFFFGKFNYGKILQIRRNISKKVRFKGHLLYTGWCPYIYYPENVFDKNIIIKFENTYISIPSGYKTYLRITYGDYMKPVIWEGGHNLRYSVDKSYEAVIKHFDGSKSNCENYNNCKFLFVL